MYLNYIYNSDQGLLSANCNITFFMQSRHFPKNYRIEEQFNYIGGVQNNTQFG